MVSVRYFSREYVKQSLTRLGCTPTDQGTDTAEAWRTRTGHIVLVPIEDEGCDQITFERLLASIQNGGED